MLDIYKKRKDLRTFARAVGGEPHLLVVGPNARGGRVDRLAHLKDGGQGGLLVLLLAGGPEAAHQVVEEEALARVVRAHDGHHGDGADWMDG